jgi:lysozyme family protein
MASGRFETCLAEVLRHEGGYVDHPDDPGGATNMGITHKTLASWRKISPWTHLPKAEVKTLTRAEVAAIYRALYWDRVAGEKLPTGLDLALFDFAVNSGLDRAVKFLQTLCGAAADGIVGPQTLAAINKIAKARGMGTIINALCDARLNFLQRLTTFSTFGKGWTTRVQAVRNAALAAANTTSSGSNVMDILNGKKTYIVAAFMVLAGIAQLLGVDLPALDGSSAMHLIMEGLAVLFLRKGLKGDLGKA